ncbi:MAG: NADH-quinone oxidoreductase subunit NuoH [Anaerolineales bacterium]|nr:NADH-quinone oxidoreductase subunit NuoH [Anaerolineales bacterium]
MTFALVLEWLIKGFVWVLILLGGFAYLTYYERRALARIQVRIGPNRAGPLGLLQPIADAVKLIFKEEFMPTQADKLLFFLAPIVTLVPALVITAVVPFGPESEPLVLFGREINWYIADLNVGVLYIMSIASIAVYGIVLAGWSSNNKYAMLGGLRSSAQMISYELALGLSFIGVILLANSPRMLDIVEAQRTGWFVLLQPVGAAIFLIATLAEVNRAPFDMPEAEQELAAGYHSEYGGMKFALLFMAEYDKMIAICTIAATLFFGGYLGPDITQLPLVGQYLNWATPFMGPVYMFLKVFILLFGMIWVRATLPRIRYDRLMAFGWKILLPLSLALIFITAVGILLAEDVASLYRWGIPVVSLVAGSLAILGMYQTLRRKEHARA